MDRRPVDSMMVLVASSVDDVRGNRTNSVRACARKWRRGADSRSCVKRSQVHSGSLFAGVETQARQQPIELVETAELHGQLTAPLGRQLDLHT